MKEPRQKTAIIVIAVFLLFGLAAGLISRAALIAAADYHQQCDERIKEEEARLANEQN
ncbi:MAG: hypothetical protein IJO72_05345 [Oscillospiraceae bacterium]|nr:hypothetical protein [Oscillospiraceae bacterium]